MSFIKKSSALFSGLYGMNLHALKVGNNLLLRFPQTQTQRMDAGNFFFQQIVD